MHAFDRMLPKCVNIFLPRELVARSATFWKASRNVATATTVALGRTEEGTSYKINTANWQLVNNIIIECLNKKCLWKRGKNERVMMKLVLFEVRAHIITDHFIPKVQTQAETKWSEELMKEICSSNVSARMEKKTCKHMYAGMWFSKPWWFSCMYEGACVCCAVCTFKLKHGLLWEECPLYVIT